VLRVYHCAHDAHTSDLWFRRLPGRAAGRRSGPRGRCGRALQHGLQLKRQGKTPEALVEMKNAVQLRPDYAAAWFTLGTLYRMEGELDNAARRC